MMAVLVICCAGIGFLVGALDAGAEVFARSEGTGFPGAIGNLLLQLALFLLSFYLQIRVGEIQDASLMEIAWCFCTPNVVLLTFGFFLLMTTIHRPGPCYALIRDISKKSYGMYLMHMFFLVMYFGLFGQMLPVYFAIPALALATYITCYVLTKVLSFIPGSKWFIG